MIAAGRPRRFDRNLVVIGAGAAGLVAAMAAARAGAAVTLIEAGAMGGDCLNTGCVPSKALLHAARLAAGARAATAMGLLGDAGPVDSAAAMRHVRAAVAAVVPHDSEARCRSFGIDVRRGRAMITSPWTVAVDGEALTTRAIIVAAGAAPVIPDIPGLATSGYLTSETLWTLDRAPDRLLILGGGPIGCELAQAFARLGAAVTLVQRPPRLLPRQDPEASMLIEAQLTQDGVTVLTDASAVAVEHRGAAHLVRLRTASGERAVTCDTLLIATGRQSRTGGYGLEALGVALRPDGGIAVNRFLQTGIPNLYACGDVTGPPFLTHAAGHEGWHAAVNALFGGVYRISPDRAVMSAVVYTDPEVASAGLSEQAARAAGIAYETTRTALSDNDRAIADNAGAGFVKVLTKSGSDRILGVAIVAPRAGEMLAEFVLAMTTGRGLKSVGAAIHAYPGYAEANKAAATAWRIAHAPAVLLPLLRRYHAWMRRG